MVSPKGLPSGMGSKIKTSQRWIKHRGPERFPYGFEEPKKVNNLKESGVYVG